MPFGVEFGMKPGGLEESSFCSIFVVSLSSSSFVLGSLLELELPQETVMKTKQSDISGRFIANSKLGLQKVTPVRHTCRYFPYRLVQGWD
jgi:hypothetical protein